MTRITESLFIKGDAKDKAVRTRCGTRAGIFGIICNFFLFAVKLTVGLFSGSVSVTADAFNNFSDMGSSLVTVFGFKLASKPADPEHPFGHGRMEYMSASLVSVLIILVGIELLLSSAGKLKAPSSPETGMLTVGILTASIVIKLLMALLNRKLGKIIESAALKAAALDSLSDCISTGAVLAVSVVCMFAKVRYLDAAAGLLVALFIIYSGIKSLKETLDPLIGLAPDPETVNEIRDIVLSEFEFTGMHDMIIHNYGPGRGFVSLHAEVPADADIFACHEKVDSCERVIRERTGMEAVIHTDPVVTDDENINRVRSALYAGLKQLDSRLTMHDFRMVFGELQSTLLFDVCVPAGCGLSAGQIKEAAAAIARDIDETYRCVITVDNDFTGRILPK